MPRSVNRTDGVRSYTAPAAACHHGAISLCFLLEALAITAHARSISFCQAGRWAPCRWRILYSSIPAS